MPGFSKVSSPKERIHEALLLREMKASELAELSGISKASISCYMSGRYEPKQEALYQMGKVLGVAEMWLAGYDIPMERPQSQKDNDELADLIAILKKEKDFRQLILRISRLKPEQILLLKSMVDSWSG